MRIHKIFAYGHLQEYIDEGYIRRQHHPTLDYQIFNYTEKTQFEGRWDIVTRTCRGLILDSAGNVLARPFEKFFNYGQPEAPSFHPETLVEVTDKMDGSLGICYPIPDGWAIATRGSFTSDQALHASEVWKDRYGHVKVPEGITLLFEIIYPENRIVVDYGDRDDLVLLGGIDIESGRTVDVPDLMMDGLGQEENFPWPLPAAHWLPMTFRQALEIPPRPNAEGIVIREIRTDHRVKLKYETYVSLHKLIFGLNERAVWERLGAGDTVETICDGLPDEFHQWVIRVGSDLLDQAHDLFHEVQDQHALVLASLPENWTRKQYAEKALTHSHGSWLFMMLDGDQDKLKSKIWSTLRPEGNKTVKTISEDVA